MATFALRSPMLARPNFVQRFFAGIAFIAEVFAESQDMQRAASRRYQFLDY